MKVLQILGASAALTALAACGGGGSSTTTPAIPAPNVVPSAGPIAPASVQMNPLTSYTVYVGSANGTDVITALSPLSSGTANPNGSVSGAAPVTLLTAGTPQMPAPAPGAVVAFPDGSTVVADALGNFDASQSAWTVANLASIAAGAQVEVIVDATSVTTSAAPLDTFVDADEPAGGTVTASADRSTLAASPAPSPTPVVLAKIQVVPASNGMFDKEQRNYFAIGFDKNGKKLALGKQKVTWSVANCSGAQAAGKLVATNESSKVMYHAPVTGEAGTCPDILTASYTNPSTAPTPSSALTLSATGKAYYASHLAAVVYSGTVIGTDGKPVAKALVDFFSTTASSSAGRLVALTDKNGKFTAKVPAGRTPAFLVVNRVATANGFKYQWFNVTVTATSPAATTGLTLKETTPTTRPSAGA
ncbi:MAG: hypothetical protein NVS3B28_06860 [Candidatus Velthaea sp.]